MTLPKNKNKKLLTKDGVALNAQSEEVLQKVGFVAKNLHESLKSLGLDQVLEKVASDIPDTRDRLAYVSKLTEQAAEKVLNATEKATPLQVQIMNSGAELEIHWKKIVEAYALKGAVDEQALNTLRFIEMTNKNAAETKALLMDIMMAQDFQDLTGQVIKKITEITQNLESQLVEILLDYSPKASNKESGLINGPQINNEMPDVAANQNQVDEILESLGFYY